MTLEPNEDKAIYTLYSKDIPLIKFKHVMGLGKKFEIVEFHKENRHLLPYLIKEDVTMLEDWITSRPIPTNREHIERVAESLQINPKNSFEFLKINNGLSLNDTYWINSDMPVDGIFKSFKDINLYENPFKEALGLITFFGHTSSLGGNLRTPELTTHGMLGKAWRIVSREIYMYKKGTSGYANSGNEPYSEVIASEIAAVLNLNHVKYELDTWHDITCSRCKLFTSIDAGYLTMSEYLNAKLGNRRRWNYDDLKELLPKEFMQNIDDMMVFDFIIENSDRHFSNFGLMRNNNTGKLLDIAPLFDNGYALMNFEMESDFKNMDYLKYSKSGTFGLTNMEQSYFIISKNPKRYKTWANKLIHHIEHIDYCDIPKYRENAIKELLKSRCEYIQKL